MAKCMTEEYSECPSNGTSSNGRCLGACRECGEHLLSTGRYTTYCPSCDVCCDCGCPNVDGFSHYAECNGNKEEVWVYAPTGRL